MDSQVPSHTRLYKVIDQTGEQEWTCFYPFLRVAAKACATICFCLHLFPNAKPAEWAHTVFLHIHQLHHVPWYGQHNLESRTLHTLHVRHRPWMQFVLAVTFLYSTVPLGKHSKKSTLLWCPISLLCVHRLFIWARDYNCAKIGKAMRPVARNIDSELWTGWTMELLLCSQSPSGSSYSLYWGQIGP